MIKERLFRAYWDSVEDCRQSIVDNLPRTPGATLLDCGCADGSLTMRFADRMSAGRVLGVEVQPNLMEEARERGIAVVSSDLNESLDVADDEVDVITANQVIEHLHNTDRFVTELHRVLKADGRLILSTNNLASWHNIVPLLIGAQPFAADVSNRSEVGKVVALFSGDPGRYTSFSHLRIFSYRALRDMLTLHGFKVLNIFGVGYYPLPSKMANRVARRDPRHAAYLTVVCSKIEPA